MKIIRLLIGPLAIVGALIGCDGKDPERLKGVGQKLAEKGRKAAEDANLPKVSVTYPEPEKK